jgi:hypothetical protein
MKKKNKPGERNGRKGLRRKEKKERRRWFCAATATRQHAQNARIAIGIKLRNEWTLVIHYRSHAGTAKDSWETEVVMLVLISCLERSKRHNIFSSQHTHPALFSLRTHAPQTIFRLFGVFYSMHSSECAIHAYSRMRRHKTTQNGHGDRFGQKLVERRR